MTLRIGADRCFDGYFDTDDECDVLCKELKQIHITAATGHIVAPTHSRNQGQIKVEEAGVGLYHLYSGCSGIGFD